MKQTFQQVIMSAIITVSCLCGVSPINAQTRQDRLEEHLYYLASDSLRGRAAGSVDAQKAAAYLKAQYQEMGLRPFFKTWEMPFEKDGKAYTDIVGVIEGSDPVLRNEYVILGAHYDHLGVKKGQIYNGADDNASGSSALVEVARELLGSRDRLKRSVIIAAFDAEELGLYGSLALAKALKDTIALDKIALMVSIDMVGYYGKSGFLKTEGSGTLQGLSSEIEKLASATGLNVKNKKFETSVMTATDTQGFAQEGVPTLSLTTGLKSPYHKPGDDPDKIDYEGLDRIVTFVVDLASDVASAAEVKPTGKVAEVHRSTPKFFEATVLAGGSFGRIKFPDPKLKTKVGVGYAAGAMFRFNIKKLGLETGGLYENTGYHLPDTDTPMFVSHRYEEQSVTVPVTVYFNIGASSRLSIGAGGWYSRTLDNDYHWNVHKDRFGAHYGLFSKVGHWNVALYERFTFGNVFYGTNTPKNRFTTTALLLGYTF